MSKLRYLSETILFDNPRPHVRSRHGYFPGVVQFPNRELAALLVIGEAFEAANCSTWLSRSVDQGASWQLERRLIETPERPSSDFLKPALLRDGTMIALGYRFFRDDPEQPIGIAETGGLLAGDNIVLRSNDGGRHWTTPLVIQSRWPEVIEISGPAIETHAGTIVALGALLRRPDGTLPSGQRGVVLRSDDRGATWTDQVTYLQSAGLDISPFETRVCQMDDGRLVGIFWAYNDAGAVSLPNQVVVSTDDGRSWSPPIDTGITAQASSLLACDGGRLLAIHAHRNDSSPGIYVRQVEFSRNQWKVIDELRIYGGPPHKATRHTTEMFASLRFGQPSLLRLADGRIVAAHWCIEDGQGKVRLHFLEVGE